MSKAKLDAPAPDALHKLAFPIDRLKHDPKNARRHEDRNLTAIRQSLETFGWRGVIVARKSDHVILAGNARVMAARQLGWKMAPVVFIKAGEKDGQHYAIIDNRSAELATWDVEALVRGLESLDPTLAAVTGFDEKEIEQFAKQAVPAAGDEQPADDEADEADAGDDQPEPEQIMQVRVEFTAAQWKRWKAALAKHGGKTASEVALRAVTRR